MTESSGRQCTKCKFTKTHDNFYKTGGECKKCHSERAKLYREKNKGKTKNPDEDFKCSVCDELKNGSEYRYASRRCNECEKAGCRKYKKNHKEDIKIYNSKYKKEHCAEMREYNYNYRIKKGDEFKEKRRNYINDYRKTNPSFKIAHLLRGRIRKLLIQKYRSTSTLCLLGCSFEQFKFWIDWQIDNFKSELNWENHGKTWHLDHVIPCAKFNLEIKEEQEKCFNWSNYQPLTSTENLKKGDKITLMESFKHEIKIHSFIRKNKEYKRKNFNITSYLDIPAV